MRTNSTRQLSFSREPARSSSIAERSRDARCRWIFC